MSAVDDAIAELLAAIDDLEPRLEGFRDFSRVLTESDGAPAAAKVAQAVQIYSSRLSLLRHALDALKALQNAGYPNGLDVASASDVLDVLRDQVASMTAAISRVHEAAEAQSAEISVESVEPK